MRLLRVASVFVLACSLAALIRAQDDNQPSENGAITGSVHDAAGQPVGGVQVLLDGAMYTTVYADTGGHYEAADLPPGSYELTFSSDGFKPLEKQGVKVNSGRVTELDVKLVREAGASSP